MAWTEDEALRALNGSDLLELGMAADRTRRSLHPEHVVTYALKAPPGHTLDEAARLETTQAAACILLADLVDIEHLSLPALEARLLALRHASPALTFHHLPLSHLRRLAGGEAAIADTLARLHAAGLRSLGPDLHLGSGFPLSQTETATLFHCASTLDIGVSTALTIGEGESHQQRLRTLAALRSLQEETHALQAVVVRIHHAATPEARREEEATAVDYLKTLAVTRLFLDSVEHVQTEWPVMGPKVLELALRFGADDAGFVPWSQKGSLEPSHHGGEAELLRIIRDAGFRPVERDVLFRQSVLRG